MRYTLSFVIALLFATLLQANEIGFIDTNKILQKASFVKSFQENFAEKEKDFNKLLKKKTEKIEAAIAKGKPEDKIREMVQKRDEELEPKKNELMEYEYTFQKNFMLNITVASKKVAEDYGVDVVLAKNAVFYGGFDLTDLVLERLNKK